MALCASRSGSLLLGAACSLIAIGSSDAWAQESGNTASPTRSSVDEIDEIVVTARRIEESIQDVPVAVTALQGDQLEGMVVNNTQDLNKLAPGLSAGACSGERNACSPVIRGQGTSFATNAPSVINYFAEVPNFQISYYDLQSLQVVKGPQGTLFGETATGGVLLYTPQKPNPYFDGFVSASAGDYGFSEIEGAVGGPIIEDILSVRVAGQRRKRDGFTKAFPSFEAGGNDFDNVDSTQWRVSLSFTPTDTIENYTMYAGSVNKSNGNSSPLFYVDPRYLSPSVRDVVLSSVPSFAAGFEWVAGYPPPSGLTYAEILLAGQEKQLAAGPRATFYNYRRDRKSIFHGVANATTWDVLDNLRIKNIFGLHWTKAKGPTLDVDGSDYSLVDTRAPWVPGTTSVTSGDYAYTGGWPNRILTNEFQLIGSLFEDRLNWQTGYYYRKSAARDWTPNQGIISVFGFPQGDPAPASFCTAAGVTSPCSQVIRSKDTSEAVFAQGTFKVTPEVSLTAGYRRTWDKRQTDATAVETYFVPFQGIPFAVPVSGRDPLPGATVVETVVPKTHEDTYTFSGDWQVTPDVLVYLTHRKGYKGGGLNNNALPDSPNRMFGPETLTDIEFGLKADWNVGGVRGRTNIAIYRDDYKDIQRSQIAPGTATTVTTNAASARLQGIELDATVFLTDWFHISGNFAYIDAYYKDWEETRICGSQWFRPQCAGLSPLTPVVIDHANGVITIDNQTVEFTPDLLQDVAKYTWALRPSLLLEPFTGQDIELAANIYHRSRWTGNASNSSDLAGVTPRTQDTILGEYSDPFFRRPHTKIDLRADWRNISGSNLSFAVSVTNVTNKLINVSNGGGFTIGGAAPAIFEEPRMFFFQARYEFGG